MNYHVTRIHVSAGNAALAVHSVRPSAAHRAPCSHGSSPISSWPGVSEISQFVSSHGTGLLVPSVLGALGIWLAMTLVRGCFGYYLRTDRASLSILDNSLTLVVLGIGVIGLAAVLAPSAGFGTSLVHDLGSLVGANSGSVGGGV